MGSAYCFQGSDRLFQYEPTKNQPYVGNHSRELVFKVMHHTTIHSMKIITKKCSTLLVTRPNGGCAKCTIYLQCLLLYYRQLLHYIYFFRLTLLTRYKKGIKSWDTVVASLEMF